MSKDLLTPLEAAAFADVHVMTIYRWIKEGKVETKRVPARNRVFVLRASLEELLKAK